MSEKSYKMFDFAFAKRHRVLVHDRHDGLVVYYTPSINLETLMEIQRFYESKYSLVNISDHDFEIMLNEFYETQKINANNLAENIEEHINISELIDEMPKTEDLLESQEDAPIIKLINSLLSEAIQMNASDIHFEVFKNTFTIRFRIDGVLYEILQPPLHLAKLIISRIKVMSKLDIAEKKIPQDGRINLKIANREIDVRVSILPSNHGERAVLRILDKKNAKLDLSELGANIEVLQKIETMIQNPNGIILVTGPTGSGKTTTLYGAINQLNQKSRNILTVEDPIEYDLPGIGQTQVNPKVGMTFSKGLRAILRQDPDIIMVGEIRDKETADIAIEASLTGHLVLSTLHTNSAIGAIVRLQDMGVQPFLLASSLIGVIAQRLVRKLCGHCKILASKEKAAEVSRFFNRPMHSIYEPVGCSECNDLGYKGRIGIYEILTLDERIKRMIHDVVSEDQISAYTKGKFDNLLDDGCKRVCQGDTSVEEILRVTNIQNNGQGNL